MTTSIYEAISDWLWQNELAILELPNGGFVQYVSGWLLVYDADGNWQAECARTSENVKKLLK